MTAQPNSQLSILNSQLLKEYWGYDNFRGIQEDIINSIGEGKDTLGLMPTGGGKSITFQVPALAKEGLCIVITPLISLMKDQVQNLKKRGIKALAIYSGMSRQEIIVTLENCIFGNYKFLYISPERLDTEIFRTKLRKMNVSMITVDESHCISQWGYDFRPAYLKIAEIRDLLPGVPVLALTATATPEVVKDIQARLCFRQENVFRMSFERKNLAYIVRKTENKTGELLHILRRMPGSAIIYVRNRRRTKEITELLINEEITADFYHAGLDDATKDIRQHRWQTGESRVMVATNAFGMGIDKPDVRIVIHLDLPDSPEAYFQEAGRAGRDGENSQCILLFSLQDVMIDRMLLDNKDFSDVDEEDEYLIRQRDIRRLQTMEGYCKTTGCLRNYILEYFGEKTSGPCDNCGNCHREYHEVDMTAEAKWVVNCVAETRGRYGLTIVLGTLMGAKRARLRELRTDQYKSYGALSGHSEAELRTLISQMTEMGYLYQTQEKYSVLKLGNITPLKDANTRVIMRTYEEKEPDKKKKIQKAVRKRSTDALTSAGYDLFEVLRKLRLEIAKEESMPPYIIFSDKTLIDMCVKKPSDEEEMLNVSGVGANKLKKYGQRFLEEIQKFCTERPGVTLSMTEEGEE